MLINSTRRLLNGMGGGGRDQVLLLQQCQLSVKAQLGYYMNNSKGPFKQSEDRGRGMQEVAEPGFPIRQRQYRKGGFANLLLLTAGEGNVSASDPAAGGGGKKHEIYVAAFGGHLFYDLFVQGWGGGPGPLGTPWIRYCVFTRILFTIGLMDTRSLFIIVGYSVTPFLFCKRI